MKVPRPGEGSEATAAEVRDGFRRRKFASAGVPRRQDVENEAFAAGFGAARSYEPAREVPFPPYASCRIVGAIRDWIGDEPRFIAIRRAARECALAVAAQLDEDEGGFEADDAFYRQSVSDRAMAIRAAFIAGFVVSALSALRTEGFVEHMLEVGSYSSPSMHCATASRRCPIGIATCSRNTTSRGRRSSRWRARRGHGLELPASRAHVRIWTDVPGIGCKADVFVVPLTPRQRARAQRAGAEVGSPQTLIIIAFGERRDGMVTLESVLESFSATILPDGSIDLLAGAVFVTFESATTSLSYAIRGGAASSPTLTVSAVTVPGSTSRCSSRDLFGKGATAEMGSGTDHIRLMLAPRTGGAMRVWQLTANGRRVATFDAERCALFRLG